MSNEVYNIFDSTSRGLVKYTSRDYDSLVKDFFALVPTLTDLWKPEAPSDPGVVLGKYLASVADMLGVNVDQVANEIYAGSVQQRKNAEKIFRLAGYTLGWYTAARTEITFRNMTNSDIILDFGFGGSNFSTVNAYVDITGASRVITYNILPLTNAYSDGETRSRRDILTDDAFMFTDTDIVKLKPYGDADGRDKVTRVGIEGELRSYTVPVKQIKENNYIIRLPSQHLDTTAVWVKAKSSLNADDFLATRWLQVKSEADFVEPEPRFAVTYDTYSNAQIQISNYLNQMENYDDNYLIVYWIDCMGVIGCVGKDSLSNLLLAKNHDQQIQSIDLSGDIQITNLSNTIELPHTHAVTGKSPETAKEAYRNSRNYINTHDSLITLPDFQRFLAREPGVDCAYVIDCQKALEINMAIYQDDTLTDSQKSKMYITNYDFPAGRAIYDWGNILDLGFDPTEPGKFVFAANFKTYTAMCFCIHNDFKDSDFGRGQTSIAQVNKTTKFNRYKPPVVFIENVIKDYRPLQAMSVELEFGYLRIFPFTVLMTIYTKRPVTRDVGENILSSVREAFQIYFSPANRRIGQKPTMTEIVTVALKADDRIMNVDLGQPGTASYGIRWLDCDIECFNPISFARYDASKTENIRIANECIIKNT